MADKANVEEETLAGATIAMLRVLSGAETAWALPELRGLAANVRFDAKAQRNLDEGIRRSRVACWTAINRLVSEIEIPRRGVNFDKLWSDAIETAEIWAATLK
jgi:hypothetical protein